MEHQGAMIPTRRGKRRRAGMARFRRLPLVFSISLCFLLFFHSSSVQAVGLSERWVNGLIEMWGIAYGNGTFVAVGWDTSPDVYDEIFLISRDGQTWVEQFNNKRRIRGITYANGQFVAVGDSSRIAISSDDGDNWDWIQADSGHFRGIAFGAGKWVAVGVSGLIVTSDDNGMTWINQDSVTFHDLNDITYGGGKFVAVGNEGTVLVSEDGETWTTGMWTPQDNSGDSHLLAIAYGDGKFVAVGVSGLIVTSDDNGETWTNQNAGIQNLQDLNDITYGDGRFVAIEEWNKILISEDGKTWTHHSAGDGRQFLRRIAFGNKKYVIVTHIGKVYTSSVNADLESLTVDPGVLTPAFDADTVAYSVYLPPTVDRIDVTADPDDDLYGGLTINGMPVTNGTATVDVAPRGSPIEIVVEAQFGNKKTYTITPLFYDPDGGGVLALNHPSVPAVPAGSDGHTLIFEFTGNLYDGAVEIDVPAGWSPPSTDPEEPGYTTADKGTVSVSGNTITVSGLTLFGGETVKISYGDKSGGGPGAAASTVLGDHEFTARSKGNMNGTPQGLAVSPVITVYVPDPDGGGVLALNPPVPAVPAGSDGHTLIFEFTGDLYDGAVEIDVPAGWSAPSTTAGDPGFTTADKGIVNVSGNTITVSGLTLFGGQSMKISYGDRSGGGPGSTASTVSGDYEFTARSKGSGDGTFANVAAGSPVVTVEPAAPAAVKVTATPRSVSANGRSRATITARVEDAHGNPVKDGTKVQFAVAAGKAALTRTVAATTGGVATTEVYSSVAGRVTVTAAADGTPASGSVVVMFTNPNSSSPVPPSLEPAPEPESGPDPETPREPAADPVPFADIRGHWAEQVIMKAAKAGWVIGDGDGTFRPDRLLTHAEAAMLLARVLGIPPRTENPSTGFADDEAIPDWARATVAALRERGLLIGNPDGTFRPDQPLTRAEAAMLLARALGIPPRTENPSTGFADDEAIPDWARATVAALAQAGYLSGYEDGTFRPDQPITRAEAVALISRIAGRTGMI